MISLRFLLIFGLNFFSSYESFAFYFEQPDQECYAIKCPIAENDPVCAFDGKCYKTFYGGYCEIIIENCKRKGKRYFEFVKDGPCCNTNDIPSCRSCDFACIEIYDPVCACNNIECKTFPNDCYVNLENCEYYENYKVKCPGECDDPIVITSPPIEEVAV